MDDDQRHHQNTQQTLQHQQTLDTDAVGDHGKDQSHSGSRG